MTADHVHDLIVVGLGAMGAAVAHHAAAAGLDVLGFDQHHPPHDMGSSHAETRVTRLAVGEGPQYLPFVARSHQIWRDIEARTGHQLFHECGGHIITSMGDSTDDRWGDFVSETAAVAEAAGIDFFIRSAEEVRAFSPALSIGDHERAGFEPTAGIVMSERAIAAQLELAAADGATLRLGERVTAIEPRGSTVLVTAAKAGTFEASRVVVAAGPWFADLAPAIDTAATRVTRQVVCWFEVDDLQAFSTERFSFIIWAGESIEEYLGVFPIPEGGTPALKVLGEQFHELTTPDLVDRSVSDAEIADLHARLVAGRLNGVSTNCVKASVCLYTNTTDDHFLIDTHPDSDRIMVMSPCSGHGFKHSTGLGEAIASWAVAGERPASLEPFRRERLNG